MQESVCFNENDLPPKQNGLLYTKFAKLAIYTTLET